MKILIYSEGRVGSHSLGQWLSDELSIPFYDESIEINFKVNEDFVKKIYYFKENEIVDFNFFNKVIVLYREDTLNQSISNVNVLETKKYHHTNDENLDAYYSLTKEFYEKNFLKIIDLEVEHKNSNKILKKLDKCLLISYEEIFINNTGQQKIEDYVGFNSKTTLSNPKLKLRQENNEIDEYLRKLIKNYKSRII